MLPGGGGLWRSLVAHHTGGVGVAGSNPVSPTKQQATACFFFFLCLRHEEKPVQDAFYLANSGRVLSTRRNDGSLKSPGRIFHHLEQVIGGSYGTDMARTRGIKGETAQDPTAYLLQHPRRSTTPRIQLLKVPDQLTLVTCQLKRVLWSSLESVAYSHSGLASKTQ